MNAAKTRDYEVAEGYGEYKSYLEIWQEESDKEDMREKGAEVHISTMHDQALEAGLIRVRGPDLEVGKDRILSGRDFERAALKAQQAEAEAAALRAMDPKARQAAEREKDHKAFEEDTKKMVAKQNAFLDFCTRYEDYM